MAFSHVDAIPFNQGIKAMAMVLGKQFARQLDRAQIRCAKIDADAFEFMLEKGVVETGVMGNEQAAAQLFKNLWGQLGEARRARYHRRIDAG